MKIIAIEIDKTEVLDEVAKVTDYTGSKLLETDAKARDRILATDEDLESLDRFWDEAVVGCEERFRRLYSSAEMTDKGVYKLNLNVSHRIKSELVKSVTDAIRSHFIAYIVAQWFNYVNKGGVAEYMTLADDGLDTAERLLYTRERPTRPTAGNGETDKSVSLDESEDSNKETREQDSNK